MVIALVLRCKVTFIAFEIGIVGCSTGALRDATRYGHAADIRVVIEHLLTGIAMVPLVSALSIVLSLSIPLSREALPRTAGGQLSIPNVICMSRSFVAIVYACAALYIEHHYYDNDSPGRFWQIAQVLADMTGIIIGAHLSFPLISKGRAARSSH